MSSAFPQAMELKWPEGATVAVVAARFNADIVDSLLADCIQRLNELGAPAITVERVPGSFELPVAAQWAAGNHDAVICLGAVIRGDTPHFEYVCTSASSGILEVGVKTSKPVIFGVLTTDSHGQALARANGHHSRGGRNFAEAATEMLMLKRKLLAQA